MSKHKFTEKQRFLVIHRANRHCEYCKFPLDYSHDSFHLEHILPQAKGGTHDLKNVALSCEGCNIGKRAYTEWPDPQDGMVVRLFNPRIDSWKGHFKWSEDLTQIIAITPVGRATSVLLELNRFGLVNSRKGLIAIGAHPAQNKIT